MQTYPFHHIKKTLDFVLRSKRSSFYRDFYEKKNIKANNVKTISDFLSLPLLTRADIATVPPLDRLFVSREKVTHWKITSGTTSGGNPLIIPQMDHPDPVFDVIANALEELRVSTVLILADMTGLNRMLINWIKNPILRKRALVFGDINKLDVAAALSARSEIDGINTNPSSLYYFLPFLKESYDLSKIKFISLGGEFISQTRFKLFRSYFKKARFHFRCGGSENPIGKGIRCEYLSSSPPSFFHPNTDFYLFEILDEQGQPVKDGGKGELVLTTLKKCAFPLIRYKTGDGLIFHNKQCQCGREGIIEVLGRVGYDFVRVFGVTIHAQMLDKAISSSIGNFDNEYQLHIFEVIHNNRLMPRLVLHLDDKYQKVKDLKNKIENNLMLSSGLNLRKLIEREIFLPLEINFGPVEEKGLKKLRIISHLN